MRYYYPDVTSKKLSDLVAEAGCDGTRILIPDLQRSYVWSPDRVILLVDSIFRDWPFGSLLTWNYKTPEDQSEDEYGIPARSFSRVVNRVDADPNDEKERYTKRARQQSDGDIMILDGQQRVQSLILAFGRGTALRLYDHEWNSALRPDVPVKTSRDHTQGVLCLDLLGAIDELHKCEDDFHAIDMTRLLAWCAVDQQLSSHEHLADSPLSVMDDPEHKYIELWKIWEVAGKAEGATRLCKETESCVRDNFADVGWLAQGGEDVGAGLMHLTTLVERFHAVRDIPISQLCVTACDPKAGKSARDAYDEAIVNIFTRLNTAGRALSNSEITYAWLKTGWNKTVSPRFPSAQTFVGELVEAFRDTPLDVDEDNIIAALSIYWCICKRSGKLLDSRDFIRGDIIRDLSAFLSVRAENIADEVAYVGQQVGAVLNAGRLNSFNAVAIALAFYLLCRDRSREYCRLNPDSSKIVQAQPNQILNEVFEKFSDRWFFVSAFSGRWATGAVAYLAELTKTLSSHVSDVPPDTLDGWKQWVESLSKELIETARKPALDNLPRLVDDRLQVKQYLNRLVAWQLIDRRRAGYRKLTFGDQKTAARCTPQLHVDHVISYAAWGRYIDWLFGDSDRISTSEALDQFSGLTQDEKQHLMLDPQKAREYAVWYAKAFINRLGNCSVLKNQYNQSKGKKDLRDFLDLVYDFSDDKMRADWLDAMRLTEVFLNPFEQKSDGSWTPRFEWQQYVEAIKNRESQMLADLSRYVNGNETCSRLYFDS